MVYVFLMRGSLDWVLGGFLFLVSSIVFFEDCFFFIYIRRDLYLYGY